MSSEQQHGQAAGAEPTHGIAVDVEAVSISTGPVGPTHDGPLSSPACQEDSSAVHHKPLLRQVSERSMQPLAPVPRAKRPSFLLPTEALGGDFGLVMLTFTDPEAVSASDAAALDGHVNLLDRDGQAAAIVAQEEISQRVFSRRVAVR